MEVATPTVILGVGPGVAVGTGAGLSSGRLPSASRRRKPAYPIAVPSAMPIASASIGISGNGHTADIANSPAETAALIFAGAGAQRSARITGVSANRTNAAMPTAPALANHHR